jgi:uncharacterized membrane protein
MAKRLVAAVILVIAVMSTLAYVRWSIWSYGSDTGTFAQTILNAFAGFTNSVEPGGTHLRTHWSPILAVLWPLVAVTRSPLSIQIAQVVLVALAAVPLYAIVKRHADDAWALRCSILALIYPPLLANAFSEFHELAFFPAVALALVWAADARRWWWFGLFAVAGAMIREDACATLIVFGIVMAVIGVRTSRRSYAIAGGGLALLCAGALAFYAFGILARFGPWLPSHFYSYVSASGAASLSAPAIVGRLTYVVEALAPLAFLPVFSRWSLLAVPVFAGILFANSGGVWRMGEHYILLAVPWLLLGSADALLRLRTVRWWRAAIVLCGIFLIAFNPMHPMHYLRAEPYQHSAGAERAMACVPSGALVATHDEWLAHFALKHIGVTQFRRPTAPFNGYLLYASDWGNAEFVHSVLPRIRAAQASGRYRVVCAYGRVVVLAPFRHPPTRPYSVSRMNRRPVNPASHKAASPI